MEQPALKGALGEVGVMGQVAPSSRPERGALPARPGRCGEERGGALLRLQEGPRGVPGQRRIRKGWEASGPRPLPRRNRERTCRYSPGCAQGVCARAPRPGSVALFGGAVSRVPSSSHSFTCPKGVACGLSGSLPFQVCPA